jgi:hypothetical protein
VQGFREGGVWGGVHVPVKSIQRVTDSALSPLIAELETKVKSRGEICIGEHLTAGRGDEWLLRARVAPIFFNEDVFFILDASCSAADFEWVVRRVRNPIGGLLLTCALPAARAAACLGGGNLSELVSHLTAMYVGAFDGEGWISWEPEE